MNDCAFALTIALLLVEHTSLAHPEASAPVQASGVGRTTFADLGDDVMEELARDFERELDVMADELQTVTAVAEVTASPADGCSSGEDVPRALDDKELRALFEELESCGDGEGAVATVAGTMTTKSPIDPAARGRARCSARTRRGHHKRRKRRRRSPRRTPPVGGGRSRRESTSTNTKPTTARFARHRREADDRSAAGATSSRSATLRHRSRAVSKSEPFSASGSLGATGTTTSRVAPATTSAATPPRRSAPRDRAGVKARSASAVQQQQQRRMRYVGVGDHHDSRDFLAATAAAAAAGTGDSPKRGSEGSQLRRLRGGVLLTAAIVTVLSTTVSGRWWPRPLVLVAVPVVNALVAWMVNTVRISNRDRKEHLLVAMKIAVVLASVIGVYVLMMALTQPLSRLGKKHR